MADVWSTYSGHWTDQGRLGPREPRFTGCFLYQRGAKRDALQTPANPADPNDLIDEDDELNGGISNSSIRPTPRFETLRERRLQLPTPTNDSAERVQRLTALAPFNFRDSHCAAANRKLFTTDSWRPAGFAAVLRSPLRRQ